jgi:phosphoglycolate phosphatase
MSSGRAPFAALDDILSQTRHLLISFDGPICSLFTTTAAARVADSLREVLAQDGARAPSAIEQSGSWLEMLSYATSVSSGQAARIESELTAMECAAVTTAVSTPYVHDVLTACHDSARPVAIISNHSASAVRAHLIRNDLNGQIRLTVARTDSDAAVLKPRPDLIELAITELGTQSQDCVFVGGSVTDIRASHAAGVNSIGYAITPRNADDLTDAGAGVIIASMANLALKLRAHPLGSRQDHV